MSSLFPPAAPPDNAPAPATVISVAELNRLARSALERGLPLLQVSGEISNLVRAASGHFYFTLKDEQAQVRCTMWRSRAQTLPFRPENGMQVEVRAQATLYEARGDFQLNVERMRTGGAGSLYEAFLRLRDKLAGEGLFDAATKRALPQLPRCIGIITSPSGAALHDALATLARRAPAIRVILYPAQVQGSAAPAALREAVATAQSRLSTDGLDALLVVRGGGSIEDLWAFNDEALARSLHAFPVPVISGVGHETDFTIADFVADQRAATPTMAAEMISTGYVAVLERLNAFEPALRQAMRRRLESLAQRLDGAEVRLVHPRERLLRADEHCTRLAQRMQLALGHRLARERDRQTLLTSRLKSARPALAPAREHLERLATALHSAHGDILHQRRERLATLAAHLEHLSPTAVLERGFSITRDANGAILRDARKAGTGSAIDIELAHGHLEAEVRAQRD